MGRGRGHRAQEAAPPETGEVDGLRDREVMETDSELQMS